MTIKDFIRILKECDPPVVIKSVDDVLYQELKDLKLEVKKNVNFPCKFNKDGCNGHEKGNMCCCDVCAFEIGYVEIIPEEDLEFYAEKFDETLGFWRPGGCILPFEYRSKDCTTWYCLPETYDGIPTPLWTQANDYYININKLEEKIKKL